MASVIRETVIDADPERVWDALRDFGAVHERLAPGFVVASQLDGDDRVITFFSGATATERLVATDDDAKRLAYSVVESALGATHHNASAQIFPAGDGRSRFVWTTDVLPDGLTATIAPMMDHGMETMKRNFESAAAA